MTGGVRSAAATARADRGLSTVDVVLRRQAGRLVVRPGASLTGSALRTVLLTLSDGALTALVINLTELFPTEAAVLAVRDVLDGPRPLVCDVRIVAESSTSRRRIGRLLRDRGCPVYSTVAAAMRAR